MRVCHFSDLHGKLPVLPPADLYVCTGDILPNFALLTFADGLHMQKRRHWRANLHFFNEDKKYPDGVCVGRKVDVSVEQEYQRRWITEYVGVGGFRKYFGSPDSPVICVRGNHDFVDLADLFSGDVWEVNDDPSRTTMKFGMKVGGCRGINYIVGEWSDELMDLGQISAQGKPLLPPTGEWEKVTKLLPSDIEIMLTHAPPYQVLDAEGVHYGSRALRQYMTERLYSWGKLKAWFFGHVHGAHGFLREADVLFSNAATSSKTYDIGDQTDEDSVDLNTGSGWLRAD